MRNNETNKSKGYGFIEFNDYIEFKHALDNSEPVIFGKKKLIFNPARNKYDNNNILNNPNLKNNNTNKNIFDDYNNYNYNLANKENININYNRNNLSQIERKNKFSFYNNRNDIKPNVSKINNIDNNSLNEQIKYSLQNIANNYSINNNFLKSKICAYYCAPFLDKKIFDINKYPVELNY